MTSKGALCRHCGMTATDCQHTFRDSNKKDWCCSACQDEGPRSAHIIPTENMTVNGQ